jgi:hypothetical protein
MLFVQILKLLKMAGFVRKQSLHKFSHGSAGASMSHFLVKDDGVILQMN